MTAYAGPSARLLALVAFYVREDGTIDLWAHYIKSDFRSANYTFVQPLPSSVDTDAPIGAQTVQQPKFGAVFVTVRRSEPDTEEGGGFHGGMEREKGSIKSIRNEPELRHLREPFDTPTPPPRCHFAELWTMARLRGAPAGAVAVIVYDPTGYHFRIDGTQFKLDFDADCTVKN